MEKENKFVPSYYRAPEDIFRELGITEPEEIDVEAIAKYCGALVVFERLTGCEARIIGTEDRAVITVNSESIRPRQRFSVGHELGHWMRDRRTMFSCKERNFHTEWQVDNPERRANDYAADLLLPESMFVPLAKNRPITFATGRELADKFRMSGTATAIRLVQFGSFPAMVVCSEKGKRKWFFRGKDVPGSIWPTDEPGKDTNAYELLTGSAESVAPGDVYADEWINHEEAGQYSVYEDSIQIAPNLVLSLIWWKGEKQERMLSELEGDDD